MLELDAVYPQLSLQHWIFTKCDVVAVTSLKFKLVQVQFEKYFQLLMDLKANVVSYIRKLILPRN